MNRFGENVGLGAYMVHWFAMLVAIPIIYVGAKGLWLDPPVASPLNVAIGAVFYPAALFGGCLWVSIGLALLGLNAVPRVNKGQLLCLLAIIIGAIALISIRIGVLNP